MNIKAVFFSILVILIFFNLLLFLSGLAPKIEATDLIFGFTTLAGIAVGVSLLPLVHVDNAMRWFTATLIVIGTLYQVRVPILTWTFPLGLGLVTNITNLFSSNPTSLSFLPFILFHFLGIVAASSGIYSGGSGD